MKKQCVRCGIHIDEPRALRCEKCRHRVDEEFEGQICRPFNYYFRWRIKKKKSLANLYSNNKQNGNND